MCFNFQLSSCGAHLFFFAIIAFNGGSQMTISNTDDGITVAKVILNTIICICTSGLTGLFYERFIVERSPNGWKYGDALAGSFVGMVCSIAVKIIHNSQITSNTNEYHI